MTMSFGEGAAHLAAFASSLDQLQGDLAAAREALDGRLAELAGHLQGIGHPLLSEAQGQLTAAGDDLDRGQLGVAGCRETIDQILAQFGGA